MQIDSLVAGYWDSGMAGSSRITDPSPLLLYWPWPSLSPLPDLIELAVMPMDDIVFFQLAAASCQGGNVSIPLDDGKDPQKKKDHLVGPGRWPGQTDRWATLSTLLSRLVRLILCVDGCWIAGLGRLTDWMKKKSFDLFAAGTDI